MGIELRELRWAIVAAQNRSLRQAAEALNIRQSTLSRALRNLEFQLGATLFERTNGGTRPTKAGQEFLDSARRQSILRLKNLDTRLCDDIEVRQKDYLVELEEKEDGEINAKWAQLNNNPKFAHANAEQKAREQT